MSDREEADCLAVGGPNDCQENPEKPRGDVDASDGRDLSRERDHDGDETVAAAVPENLLTPESIAFGNLDPDFRPQLFGQVILWGSATPFVSPPLGPPFFPMVFFLVHHPV
jgi:hypothetical protein